MKEQINSDSKSKNQRITNKFKKWKQRKKGTVEGVRQFREESGEIVRRINQKVEKEKEKEKKIRKIVMKMETEKEENC